MVGNDHMLFWVLTYYKGDSYTDYSGRSSHYGLFLTQEFVDEYQGIQFFDSDGTSLERSPIDGTICASPSNSLGSDELRARFATLDDELLEAAKISAGGMMMAAGFIVPGPEELALFGAAKGFKYLGGTLYKHSAKLTGQAARKAWGELAELYRQSNSGPGRFVRVIESMSHRAARYQSRITGRLPDVGYRVGNVKFDGYDDVSGVLLDAKGPGYAKFVRNGRFRDWYCGADEMVDQATRQIRAASGTPIEWHIAEKEAADAIRRLLTDNGISGIIVKFVP